MTNNKAIVKAILAVFCFVYTPVIFGLGDDVFGFIGLIFTIIVRLCGLGFACSAYDAVKYEDKKPLPPTPDIPEKNAAEIDSGLDNLKKL